MLKDSQSPAGFYGQWVKMEASVCATRSYQAGFFCITIAAFLAVSPLAAQAPKLSGIEALQEYDAFEKDEMLTIQSIGE